MTPAKRSFEFTTVDPCDVDAVREWAELRCKGWTLERLAASVGVEPSIEAVGAQSQLARQDEQGCPGGV